MDYADGYMAKNIPKGVEFMEYQRKAEIPKDSIIVFQGVYPYRIKNFKDFPKTCKVLFWHLHPDNYFPYIKYKYFRHKFKKYITFICSYLKIQTGRELIKTLLKNNSLVFMDKTNFDSTKNYFFQNQKMENPKYLKIFTDDIQGDYRISNKKDEILSFGWLGRLEDFKTSILLHTLKRLQSLNFYNFKFMIIGKGKDSVIFKDFQENCSEYDISIIDEINSEEISSYINNFDLLFAMGTSALEGAKLGIPTILLDYSYTDINGLYKYEFIFEKEGYSLAEQITNQNLEDKCSLPRIISMIKDDKYCISMNCIDYWKENFSPIVFKSDFIEFISKSKLKISDLLSGNFHKPDIFTKLLFFVFRYNKTSNKNTAWQF